MKEKVNAPVVNRLSFVGVLSEKNMGEISNHLSAKKNS